LASKKFAKIIKKVGFSVKFKDFKVHNIVATAKLKFPVNLDTMYIPGTF